MAYAIGDVEFHQNQRYLWPLLIEEDLDALVEARQASHPSFPNTVYEVDRQDVMSLRISFGHAGGTRQACARVLGKVGNWFDLT